MKKLIPISLLAALGLPVAAQVELVSPSLRNGGFEDINSTDFSSTPFWESFFTEAEAQDPTSSLNPASGSLSGVVTGFQGPGQRVHLTQTFSGAEWIIQSGDVFQVTYSAAPGEGFDWQSDAMQTIIHVIDGESNPVNDFSGPGDRLFSALSSFSGPDEYQQFSVTSDPILPTSPWIGERVRLRFLHNGDRNEFAFIDDVTFTGFREQDLAAEPTLIASYDANGNVTASGGSAGDGTADAALAYGPGFGIGQSFNTQSGGLQVPVSMPQSYSIAFWMRTNQPGNSDDDYSWTDGSILVDGTGSGGDAFGISVREEQIAFGTSDAMLLSRTLVADGQWHHVVATRSQTSGNTRLYVDGELQDVATDVDILSSVTSLQIGSDRAGRDRFQGLIDDLRIYQGLLDAEDIDLIRIPDGDSDGDGSSNLDEVAAGTSWGDANDFLRIEDLFVDSSGMSARVAGKVAREYQLHRIDALESGDTTVVDSVPGFPLAREVNLVDPNPPTDRALYQVTASQVPAARPNILLIVGDDQGFADISAYPNAKSDISTPSLDRIAASGTIFTQAYVTAPVCSPSRCGYLTGRYQNEWDPIGGWTPRLPSNVKTIAEYLKEAGYATAMIGKNDFGQPVGTINNREQPTNHGFDQFFGFSAHAHDFYLHSPEITDSVVPAWPTEASAHLGQFENSQVPGLFETFEDGRWQTEIFTDRALEYLDSRRNQTEPFFLYLSHASVHALIHQAPKEYLDAEGVPELPLYDPNTNVVGNPARYTDYYFNYSRPFPQLSTGIIADLDMRKYYRAHLNAFDDEIGRLLDGLEASGMAEDTLVIYFSDNGGEALTGANNQPLSGSKYNTFEGGLRVPLMISWPGKVPAGQVYEHVTSTLDIVPTLLEVAGVRDAAPLSGHSLMTPMAENTPVVAGDRTLFWRFNSFWAIRHGDYKLMFSGLGIAARHTSEIVFNSGVDQMALYNLAEDPSESNNLFLSRDRSNVRIRTELQSLFNAWEASNRRSASSGN